MYGLPQAGLLAQEFLEQILQKHRYTQSKVTPGFWTHVWSPISFTLVVNDFGVKYVGKENADPLVIVLKKNTKSVRIGMEKNMLDKHLIETTRSNKSMCPYLDM